MKQKFLFGVVLILSLITNAIAQDDQGFLEVKGTVKQDRKGLSNVKAEVYINDKLVKTYSSDANGRFECELDLNANCVIIISKQGYFSKRLWFNTNIPPEDVGIWSYRFAMELLPAIEGFDASLFDEPIGKIMFDDSFGDFDYDRPYTEGMQKKIKALMKEYEKARRAAFEKIIAQADAAFNNADYDLSQELYDAAIDLDPYDPYPDDQIAMIGKIRAKDKNADKNYQRAIAKADAYLADTDYKNAKLYYNRALNYKEKEPYPNDQIAYIEKLLSDREANEADLLANEKAYQAAIAAADRGFNTKNYDAALQKYQEASGLKSNEQYPKDKIIEITALLAQLNKDKDKQAEIEKAYREAIALADNEFGKQEYSAARSNYVKAQGIKPAETYPKTKISEIDNLLAANKSREEKYKGFVQAGDAAFNIRDFNAAKENYQLALSIKSTEQYPQNQIMLCDQQLLLLAQNKEKEIDAAYQQALNEGNRLFGVKDYNTSRNFYSKAASIKPSEAYPKQKIAEIDGLLAALAGKKRAYDLAIASADNAFNAENWESAKTDYEKALSILPDEQYPQSKLTEINNKLLALQNAQEQRAAREAAYQQAIAKADSLFKLASYSGAKSAYNEALTYKSTQKYPRDQINEIDRLLAQQKALEEQYNMLIASADQLFTSNKYEEARGDYYKASQLKPQEGYPIAKMSEIDGLLAKVAFEREERAKTREAYEKLIAKADIEYQNENWSAAKSTYNQAIGLISTEIYPKQQITNIDNMLAGAAAKEKAYTDAIALGDNLLNQKSYQEAISAYSNALDVKPTELYPQQKIVEINQILEQLLAKEAAYDNYVKQADVAFTNSNLAEAKNLYTKALEVKSGEAYPQGRLIEIAALESEQLQLLAQAEALNKKYNGLIQSADSKFNQQDYQGAKSLYTQALEFKPQEMYPKEKLNAIDNILETLAARDAAYTAKMNEASSQFAGKNYEGALASYKAASGIKPNEQEPKTKMAEINALLQNIADKQAQYNGFVAQADALFNQKKYREARPIYSQALALDASQAYPQQKITQIDQFIAEEERKQQEQAQLLASYNAMVKQADAYYTAKNYDEAISAYMDAKMIKGDESYPDQQIAKINQQLQADARQLEAQYKQAISQGDAAMTQENWTDAKLQYQQALVLKPNDRVASNKLVELENLISRKQAEQNRLAQVQAEYDKFIGQADKLFQGKEYASALAMYKSANRVMPSQKYAKDRMQLCEIRMREQQQTTAKVEEKQQGEVLAAQSNEDFDYRGEERTQEFLQSLAEHYPEGRTVENYSRPNKKIKRIIIKKDGIVKEYIEVKYSYGTYYFRNGKNISRSIFNSESR